MSRMIPHPILSAVLFLMWLLLTRFTAGQAILGGIVALVAGWSMGALEPAPLRLRRPDLILRLAGRVAADIFRSNVEVARLILTDHRNPGRRSGMVEVPLRITDPAALATLAIILTATPGTAWLDHDAESNILLLHVFDLKDPEESRATIAARYESLLLEIFA